MKLGRIFLTGFFGVLAMAVSVSSRGEDIDIFLTNPAIAAQTPNVLIILDNTANWNTPFVAEKTALVSLVTGLKDNLFNVGLMMYTESGGANKGPTGGYMRYAVRLMNSTHKFQLAALVNGLDILSDKSNSGKAGLTMFEAYLYYAGGHSYAGGPPGNPVNGKIKSDNGLLYLDTGAFNFGTATYKSPITDGCQKNFIIYISNGPPQDSSSDTHTATDFLHDIGGDTTTMLLNPSGSQANIADEYARFLANHDISTSIAGTQNVIVYTVDVLPGTTGQGPGWTALLKNMANQGKGRYFATTGSTSDIADALNKIFEEVQAINNVFASSTLPVSVNVRGTYLNQVYMGVFRPDANSSPRWAGNLKQYKLGVDTSTAPATLFLTDKLGQHAESAASGFIIPGAESFWTTGSTFWNASYYPNTQGSGGISDLPDGDLVEKGGAAQHLRTSYATSQATRNLYTCTTGCVAGSSLSGTSFNTANANITQALLGAASATERDNIINWVRGANNKGDDNPDLLPTSIRGFVHGDALHSRPAVINYNRYGTDSDIVVYYGSNDAIFHAVKGGQADSDGVEKWGFIMPEHFGQLKRLRDASPLISTTNPKSYFADGSTGIYQLDSNNDGKLVAADGDKVYLFIGMRRGGRFIYALDVSDPDNPKLLWKKSNTDSGYAELGQTWSEPKVSTIRGHTGPVLIFGLGYDAAANDAEPATTATMGRGVMIADAATGQPIWQAGPAPSGATYNKVVAGMTFSIAADMTVLDTNGDGKADRIYAADTGGNVWRINIDDTNPDNWTVSKLAAVGGTDANARKFLYPPDVVYSTGYDAVLIGSGDREHPFDTTIQNRYYMFKDSHDLNATRDTPITEAAMYDATANLIQAGTADQQAAAATSLASSSGWYVSLSLGEKVVGGSTTLRGGVYFATNKPSSTLPGDSCTNNLGEVRLYTLNYANAGAFIDRNKNGVLETSERYVVRAGGGYPPSPVPVVVQINGTKYEAVIIGSTVTISGTVPAERRFRTFWFRE